ncbi:prephenate dehydratase domain-containing protein [Gallaecimonas xiamenensis]|uniref:Bifunctional chorismate mutase/prephenate dehydratase n=1 Tax=Gallaecimonas xiamenensis 3-C-1 TaxID=745411 RepID=K2JU99_9GAMM|nr:prephenate dehydratase domain-containing protein [Gallaecimonas xiamenensis]EKE68750.1 chorismate mutase [Gallaecimonas xiamenensis 3-C-1]
MDLNSLRQQIESLDKDLLGCLAKRRQLALAVAKDKAQRQGAVRDQGREASLLLSLMEKGKALGLDPAYLTRLYHIIIEDSVLLQQAWMQQGDSQGLLHIAHLGQPGTYSHLAAQGIASRHQSAFQGLSCESFADIVKAVEDGKAPLGLLPIENTSSGSINDVYDLLRHTHLHIVGETYLKVDHHLLVKPGLALEDIQSVYAHPQALTQCSQYLAKTPFKQEACASSAHAMAKVADLDAPVAAIGPESGGALYGLVAIDRHLANQEENHTRFILVSRDAQTVPAQLPAKTSLIMATHNTPGALVDALLVLRQQGINMTKLESRPMPGNPWEELFYVDLAVNDQSEAWQGAYQELAAITRFVKVLGCYPDQRVKPTTAPLPR